MIDLLNISTCVRRDGNNITALKIERLIGLLFALPVSWCMLGNSYYLPVKIKPFLDALQIIAALCISSRY